MCVAKLHDINAQLVEDQGFLDLLKDLLSDSTPMVVANAVAALAEIGEVSPTGTDMYTCTDECVCTCTCGICAFVFDTRWPKKLTDSLQIFTFLVYHHSIR